MSTPRHSKPNWQKRIAGERIETLMKKAESIALTKPEYSARYVEMAIKIAMRYNIHIPDAFKKRFCKKCHAFLIPGKTATVRTRAKQQSVIIKCLNCGNIMRHPYRREKQKNR